jgi:hypothetical protein
MREINVHEVTETVGELCIAANYELGTDVLDAFERAIAQEDGRSFGGRWDPSFRYPGTGDLLCGPKPSQTGAGDRSGGSNDQLPDGCL